jgi:hypothetical protein
MKDHHSRQTIIRNTGIWQSVETSQSSVLGQNCDLLNSDPVSRSRAGVDGHRNCEYKYERRDEVLALHEFPIASSLLIY